MNKKLNLNNVTLVNVDGRTDENELYKSLKSLIYSSLEINFKEILFLSPKIYNPTLLSLMNDYNIIHHVIPILTYETYSSFMLKDLYNYIKTDYCLTVQWDGFILNSHLWNDEFLNYDYIGAAWDFERYPFQTNSIPFEIIKSKGIKGLNRVGNGGFSLRSKKLLEITSKHSLKCTGPEDTFICQTIYDDLINQNIKFAPVEVADVFSKDPLFNTESTFGFHGEKNLINTI